MKWTEREEAPKWIKKMAPSKGGTALPTKTESVVISVMLVVGYYAWFVDSGSLFVDSEKVAKESTEGR